MKNLILISVCSFLCLSANGFQLNPNEESEKEYVTKVAGLLNLEPKTVKYYEGKTKAVPSELKWVDGKWQSTPHPSVEIKCHAKIANDGTNILLNLTTQKYLKYIYSSSVDHQTDKAGESNSPKFRYSGNSVTRQSVVGYDYKDLSSYSVTITSDTNKVSRKQYKANLADQNSSSESITVGNGLTINADSYQTAFFVVPFNTDADEARFFNCSQMVEVSKDQYEKDYSTVLGALK